MRILIIQITRIGDIYQTWPALRSLRRNYPEAHISLMVRQGNRDAAIGLHEIDEVIEIPTRDILKEMYNSEDQSHRAGIAELDKFLNGLNGWDQIHNLSYSPFSSYVTFHLSKFISQSDSSEGCKVTGYSRSEDGYLALPDDMSAYFYAQVGKGRPNRFHICEIFASQMGLDLIPSDWKMPILMSEVAPKNEQRIMVHVGASDVSKSISVSKWISILAQIRNIHALSIELIGSAADFDKAEQIRLSVRELPIKNRCGQWALPETLANLRNANLLIGPDSSPMHMASLTQTPCLNLSVGPVKYFETGPRSIGSVVLSRSTEAEIASEEVAELAISMLQGIRLPMSTIQVGSFSFPIYDGESHPDFEWEFVQALYLGVDFPAPVDALFVQGLTRLSEVNTFMIEALEPINSVDRLKNMNELLKRGEEVIETIGKLVPNVTPLVRWYMTEKLRVGPGQWQEIIDLNLKTHRLLAGVLKLYGVTEGPTENPEREL